MRRAIDAPLRAMRFASPFSSSSSPLNSVRRTILTQYHFHALSPKPHSLSPPKTLVPHTNTASASSILGLGSQTFSSGFGLLVVRCISSVSPAHTLEWNEPVSCSEVGDGNNETVEEDTKPSIPVRAYFFSTRFVSIWVSVFRIDGYLGVFYYYYYVLEIKKTELVEAVCLVWWDFCCRKQSEKLLHINLLKIVCKNYS